MNWLLVKCKCEYYYERNIWQYRNTYNYDWKESGEVIMHFITAFLCRAGEH